MKEKKGKERKDRKERIRDAWSNGGEKGKKRGSDRTLWHWVELNGARIDGGE